MDMKSKSEQMRLTQDTLRENSKNFKEMVRSIVQFTHISKKRVKSWGPLKEK